MTTASIIAMLADHPHHVAVAPYTSVWYRMRARRARDAVVFDAWVSINGGPSEWVVAAGAPLRNDWEVRDPLAQEEMSN